MQNNLLVIGSSQGRKTTLAENIRKTITSPAGGLLAPERRVDSERVGFDLIDVFTDDRVQTSCVDRGSGPGVGNYRVDVPTVDRITTQAFDHRPPECYLIDEIAPMEVRSDTFVRRVRKILESSTPVVASLHHRQGSGFCSEVRTCANGPVLDLTEWSIKEVTAKSVGFLSELDIRIDRSDVP